MRNAKKMINNYLILFFIPIILSSCNLGYKVENDKVYYKYWHSGMGIETRTFEIIGADAKTLKIFENDNYAVDKIQAYYKGKPILKSDPKTFVAILNYYAKDDYHAYYNSDIINNADGKSFTVIDGGPYSKDKNDFYYDTTALKVADSSFKRNFIFNQKLGRAFK